MQQRHTGLTPFAWILILVIVGAVVFGAYHFVVSPMLSGQNSVVSKNSGQNGAEQPRSSNNASSGSTSSGQSNPPPKVSTGNSNNPKIQVGLAQFGTYLSAVGATKFADSRGVSITLVDLSSDIDKQCDWVAGRLPNDKPAQGVTRMLFTTQNQARLCDGVQAVMVIDQSSGADQIITRPEITNFNQLLSAPVSLAGGCSVSEYLYRTLAWAFGSTNNANLKLATGAPEAQTNFAKDPSIKTLVTYVPFTDDAMKVSGSKKFFDTEHWAGIVDMAVIKADNNTNPAVQRFMAAWFDFVKLEQENYDQAWPILDEYHKSHREETLIGDYTHDALKDELTNLVAQATYQDNLRMMVQDTNVLQARFNEVDAIQREFPCSQGGQVAKPSSLSVKQMIDGRYIQALQNDQKVQTSAKPLSKRRVTLSTTVPLEQALSSSSQQLIGQLSSVYVEFQPDSDQFVDENDARDKIERNFAAILRLTNNTKLALLGGYAVPFGCTNCDDVSGSELAKKRSARVAQLLTEELKIPKERVTVASDVRKPANAGSRDPALVAQDRRVEGSLLVVGGQ